MLALKSYAEMQLILSKDIEFIATLDKSPILFTLIFAS